MNTELKRTEKHEEARNTLSEEMQVEFDRLVNDYRFYATVHHRGPFVSYVVLADMIRAGWRKMESTNPG